MLFKSIWHYNVSSMDKPQHMLARTSGAGKRNTTTYVSVGPCEEGDGLAEAEAVDHHDAGQRAADATRLQNN
jgi:hypothetical protein